MGTGAEFFHVLDHIVLQGDVLNRREALDALERGEMFKGEFKLFEFVGVSLGLEFKLGVGGHDLFDGAL